MMCNASQYRTGADRNKCSRFFVVYAHLKEVEELWDTEII